MKVIHAHYREAHRIQPGWQIRCDGKWLTVQTVLIGKHIPTNTPVRIFYFDNGDNSRCESYLEVLCRNKVEIRRAAKAAASLRANSTPTTVRR